MITIWFVLLVFVLLHINSSSKCDKDALYMSDDYEIYTKWWRSEIIKQPFYSISVNDRQMIYPQLRPEGFNNQMISVFFYIQAALLSGRALVLPLMLESRQWDAFAKMGPTGPFPFLDYFDFEHLMKLIPIVDRDDYVSWCFNTSTVILVNLGDDSKETAKLMVQEFYSHQQENMGGPTLKVRAINVRKKDVMFCNKDTDDPCLGPDGFSSTVLNVLRRKADPEASVLPTCLMIERHLVSNVGFGSGPFFDFSKGYQGHSIQNKKFRNVFTSIRPSKALACVVRRILEVIGGPFNGMHVRRGDFKAFATDYKMGGANNKKKHDQKMFGVEAIWQSNETIVKMIYNSLYLPLLPVYIASDEPAYVQAVLKDAGVTGLRTFSIADFIHLFPAWMRARNDLHLVVEQNLLVNASLFVGNRYSSVSSYVFRHRLLANAPSLIF